MDRVVLVPDDVLDPTRLRPVAAKLDRLPLGVRNAEHVVSALDLDLRLPVLVARLDVPRMTANVGADQLLSARGGAGGRSPQSALRELAAIP